MGIGHALLEEMPLYEGGPAEGDWNFNRYRLPRAKDVAVWSQTAEILPPLSPTDPAKGIAEVVMIPVVGAIANAVAHATGSASATCPSLPPASRRPSMANRKLQMTSTVKPSVRWRSPKTCR